MFDLLLFATSVLRTSVDGPKLVAPFRLRAAAVIIDVDEGGAAPCIGDIDGDGRVELLVGQSGGGRLRIYHRSHSDGELARLPDLRVEEQFASVPAAFGMGFCPQLADLDGDGIVDIVSGSFSGAVFLFHGIGRGNFASAVELRMTNGKPVQPGHAVVAVVADWDRDGRLDLIVGDQQGRVYFLPNDGTRSAPRFGDPIRLVAASEPIKVASYAAPAVADWDGDGRQDLLLGAGDGGVRFYRAVGDEGRPDLVAPTMLVPTWGSQDGIRPFGSSKENSATEAKGPAICTKVCVTDWDGDGRPDLLVGDYHYENVERPPLTEAESRELDSLHREMQPLRQQRSKLRAPAESMARKELGFGPVQDLDSEQMAALGARITALLSDSAEYAKADAAYSAAQDRLRQLIPAHEAHGHVWAYLRTPR